MSVTASGIHTCRRILNSLLNSRQRLYSTLKPIEQASLPEEVVSAARCGASTWPPTGLAPHQAAEAASLLGIHFLEVGTLPPECSVTIHQLMRTVATCQFWRLPTVVDPREVRSAADLVTGSTESGDPLLVVFPDDESCQAHAAAAGFEVAGSIEMSSLNLLESWQASQYSASPIAGVVIHTAETAAKAAQPAALTARVLPTMLGLAYSLRVEAAARVVEMWREAGLSSAQVPSGELALLARHPFGVLHHKKDGSLLERLCDGRSAAGPLLFAAADTVLCEHLQLNTQTAKYQVQHCTIGMVMRALQKADSMDDGWRLVYGWDESIRDGRYGPESVWEGGKKLCLEWPTPQETLEIFQAAGIDLLDAQDSSDAHA